MPVNPPPPAIRTSPWVSRLGRAAVAMLVAGIVVTPATFVNGALPFWLIPVGTLLIVAGLLLGALWLVIRLAASSIRLGARQPSD